MKMMLLYAPQQANNVVLEKVIFIHLPIMKNRIVMMKQTPKVLAQTFKNPTKISWEYGLYNKMIILAGTATFTKITDNSLASFAARHFFLFKIAPTSIKRIIVKSWFITKIAMGLPLSSVQIQ